MKGVMKDEVEAPAADERALEALAAELGAALAARRMLVATAESCTGGAIAHALTETAGSSAWFDRGFVTYSNEAKEDQLGVTPRALRQHGAVSEAVAREMALGALAHSRSALALAVTGIAGPSGGSDDKPVGTVCFGWALEGGGATTETRHLDGDRRAIRLRAARHALEVALSIVRGLSASGRIDEMGVPPADRTADPKD